MHSKNFMFNLSVLAGITSFLLGLVVLFGWYTQNPELIQVNPAFVPMQYNTALGFLLSGIGLTLLYYRPSLITKVSGFVVALIGILTLLEYLFNIDLMIDQLFMEHYIDVNTSHPGRMAPNTALCFTISGTVLFLGSQSWNPYQKQAWIGILGAVTFSLGLVAFSGYLSNIETAYGWGALTKMALHTAFGFMVLGVGFFFYSLRHHFVTLHEENYPGWFPVAIAVASFTLTGALWQALHTHEVQLVNKIGETGHSLSDETMLIFGLVITFFLFTIIKSRINRETEKPTLNKHAIISTVFILGFLLASTVYLYLSSNFEARIKIQFEASSEDYASSISNVMNQYFESLYHLRSAFSASDTITREEFRKLTKRDINQLKGLKSLHWAPRVSHENRIEWEQTQSRLLDMSLHITEYQLGGKTVQSKQRLVYFPVLLTEPFKDNRPVLGLDISTTSDALTVLSQAVETDRVVVSEPVDLVQTEDHGNGVIVYLPIYQNNLLIDSVVERREALKGFAVAVLDMHLLLDALFSSQIKNEGLAFLIEDISSSAGKQFLFKSSGFSHDKSELSVTLPIQISNRQWQISLHSVNDVLYPKSSLENVFLPLIIFLATLTLMFYIRKSITEDTIREELLEQLAKNERYARTLVETIPGSVYTCLYDQHWTIKNISDEVQKLTGFPASDFIDNQVRSLDSIIHPSDKDKINETVLQAVKCKKDYELEYRIIDSNNEVRWVFDRGQAEFDQQGNVKMLHGTMMDITRLHDLNRDFIAILNHSSDFLYIKDAQHRFRAVNLNFAKLIGHDTPFDCVGKTDFDVFPEENAKVFYESERKVIEQGEPLIDHIENYIRPDGTKGWVKSNKRPILDDDGTVIGLFGFSAEITELIDAKEMLEESREQLTTILNTSPVGVGITVDGVLEYANDQVSEMLGLNEGDDIKHIYADPEQREKMLSLLSEQDIVKNYEVQFYDANHNKQDMMNTFYSVDYKGQKGILSWVINVSHLKQVQKDLEQAKKIAEEATRAKSDFLANMSHEIRTPMNAILGLSHLALETELTPKQQDYISKVYDSAESLLGIINDILDFSKIEAGKLDIESINFDLHQLLSSIAMVNGVKAAEKEIELIIDVKPDLIHILIGDPHRLEQILNNLVNNAIKFTETGHVKIEVQAVEQGQEQIVLLFSIVDTGIGLSIEQQEKLFQTFSQADSSITRKYGGTGLGLTISKKLTELLGGEIGLESTPGHGSRFYFQLPFLIGTQQPEILIPDESISELNVLVVDDNAITLEIATSYLESFSFKVEQAQNGEQALDKIQRAEPPFDLVFMDWRMPGMDGIETAQLIRKNTSLMMQPKIIISSAFGRDVLPQMVEESELDGYLIKPLTPSSLFDVINEVFRGIHRNYSSNINESELAEPDLLGANLLVVEDNEINQQVARELLQNAGLNVTTAENGEECIQLLESSPQLFDGVLMDIQMPVMDGYEATKQIRKDERFINLPIIAMTANALQTDIERCLEYGMNDHVAKPIDVQDLFIKLNQWVKASDPKVPESYLSKDTHTQTTHANLRIGGIDTDDGLKRIGGNHDIYIKMLKKFAMSNENTMKEITNALSQNDRETARRLAHTIKGVSGNMGAHQLHESVKELELQFKEERETDETMALVASELEKVITNINQLPELKKSKKTETMDKESVDQLIVTLREYLEKDNSKALQVLEQINEQIKELQLKLALEAMNKSVSLYDFEQALIDLDVFIEQYNKVWL